MISDRASHLLREEEGFDVDFKRSMSGLEAEDLVSFANSKAGGAVLVGVDESKDDNGRQVAVIVGCPVGDAEKLKILSKSNQCVPPVAVSIYIENSAEKPFYRIEIPSGPHKPYCTSGGTYKTRGDGRKETLYPPKLLALFLETEGGEFLRRFQQATESLESSVRDTKERLVKQLKDVGESIWELERNIEESLSGIGEVASNAESNAEDASAVAQDAASLIDQVHSMVEDLASPDPELSRISGKLDALLGKFDIEDPWISSRRRFVQGLARGLAERVRQQATVEDRNWIISMVSETVSQPDKATVARWAEEALQNCGEAGGNPEEPLSSGAAAWIEKRVERMLAPDGPAGSAAQSSTKRKAPSKPTLQSIPCPKPAKKTRRKT